MFGAPSADTSGVPMGPAASAASTSSRSPRVWACGVSEGARLRNVPRLTRWEGESEALQDGAAGDVAGEHDEWDAAARL